MEIEMDRFKRVLMKLLFPGGAVVISLTIVSAALLIYVFVFGSEYSALAYLTYVVSAYTLTILCRLSISW